MYETKKLQELTNIGTVLAKELTEIGIESVEDFMSRDPYDVFELLLKKDPTSCRCKLASIVGAHEDVKWHTVTKKSAEEWVKRHPDFEWGTC